MNLRQYSKADIVNQRVILRADLDVNPDEDSLRLERLAPTVKELLSYGAKQIVIIGHRGRPEGKFEEAFSLAPVKERLEQLLNKTGVQLKINLVTVDSVNKKPDDILMMLENLRFYPGEKKGDLDFARELSRWGEVYVNDAFGNSHRSDASMLALPQALGHAFAGPGLASEIKNLSLFRENTPHPFAAVLGGVKIETKLPLIKFLVKRADVILVGGALANTILAGQGINVGQSLVEKEYFSAARELKSEKLILPIDGMSVGGRAVELIEVASDDFIADIGPKTVALFKAKLSGAAAILWNGPMGKFEDPQYQNGTKEIVEAIVTSGAATVTGGGDTLDVLAELKVQDKFGFVSVGGGAMLTFLAGEKMPALEILYE